MRHAEATRERERYASALAGLWSQLARTLAQLESLAADPEERLLESAEALPSLQYALHRAEELADGIDPPSGTELAHAELAAALTEARDITGEIAHLVQDGAETAIHLAHEWRGALFRVRLARRELISTRLPGFKPGHSSRLQGTGTAAASILVVLAGVGAFTAGAVLALWFLWAIGLVLVALGYFVYRP